MGASGPDPALFGTAQPEISESNLDRKFPVGRNIPIEQSENSGLVTQKFQTLVSIPRTWLGLYSKDI